MHSFNTDEVNISYNSDFSGNIKIVDKKSNEVEITARVILNFVAFCYVRPMRIAKLENATAHEVLTMIEGDKCEI